MLIIWSKSKHEMSFLQTPWMRTGDVWKSEVKSSMILLNKKWKVFCFEIWQNSFEIGFHLLLSKLGPSFLGIISIWISLILSSVIPIDWESSSWPTTILCYCAFKPKVAESQLMCIEALGHRPFEGETLERGKSEKMLLEIYIDILVPI